MTSNCYGAHLAIAKHLAEFISSNCLAKGVATLATATIATTKTRTLRGLPREDSCLLVCLFLLLFTDAASNFSQKSSSENRKPANGKTAGGTYGRWPAMGSFQILQTPARLGCANHAASRSSVCHRGPIATTLRLKRTVPKFICVSHTRVYKAFSVFS